MADARTSYDQGKAVIEQGLADKIDHGLTGKSLFAAVKDAKSALYQNSQTAYNPKVQALMDGTKGDQTPTEILRGLYWGADVPESYTTDSQGNQVATLDYADQEQTRADILRQAAAKGIDPKMVTERKPQFSNPKVQAAVDLYDKTKAAAKPYYDNRDAILKEIPAVANAVEQARAADAAGIPALANRWRATDAYKAYEQMNKNYRLLHPEVDQAGVDLGYWSARAKR